MRGCEDNWMDFNFRQYDPQTGRFLGVDPLGDYFGQDRYSPYAAMGNQPESMIDPNGLAFNAGPAMLTMVTGLIAASLPPETEASWARIGRESMKGFKDHESYAIYQAFGGGGGYINPNDVQTFTGASAQAFHLTQILFSTIYKWAGNPGGSSTNKNDVGTLNQKSDNSESPIIIFMFSGAKFSGDGTSETLESMASELREIPNSLVITVGSDILNNDNLNAAEYASYINILLNQLPGGKVFLYGYSYGAVVANEVAKRLGEINIPIEYMAIVDGAKGIHSNSINRTISGNVKYTDNFYQTTPEFLTGSHGAPYGGANTVNNYHMGYSHSAMDEVTRGAIMRMIRAIVKYNK